jgi:hypothetical protein
LRHFPAEAFIFSAGMLGLLSWTADVEVFRLGIPQVYEHMLAYALLAILIIVAKGLRLPSVFEISLIIVMAASMEALKFGIPFRHPKTSDFYADLFGFFTVILAFYCTRKIAHLIWRAIDFFLFPSARRVSYWRP